MRNKALKNQLELFEGVEFRGVRAEAIRELVPAWRKTAVRTDQVGNKITCSGDAAKVFKALVADDPYENFWTLFLDSQNQIIGVEKVTRGTVSQASPHIRNIMAGALVSCAAAMICCHNHPSGNPKPSDEDVEFTEKLVRAGEIIQIKLLDHVIIGNSLLGGQGLNGHYSFADNEKIN